MTSPDFITLVSSSTVSVALSAALVWLSRAWIGERLRAAIGDEYARKIEVLKNELKRESDSALEHTKAALARAVAEQQEAARLRMQRRFDAVTACYMPLHALYRDIINATTPFADHQPEAMQQSLAATRTSSAQCDEALALHRMHLPADLVLRYEGVRGNLVSLANSWEFNFNRTQDRSEALGSAKMHWEKTGEVWPRLQLLERELRALIGEPSANDAGANPAVATAATDRP